MVTCVATLTLPRKPRIDSHVSKMCIFSFKNEIDLIFKMANPRWRMILVPSLKINDVIMTSLLFVKIIVLVNFLILIIFRCKRKNSTISLALSLSALWCSPLQSYFTLFLSITNNIDERRKTVRKNGFKKAVIICFSRFICEHPLPLLLDFLANNLHCLIIITFVH